MGLVLVGGYSDLDSFSSSSNELLVLNIHDKDNRASANQRYSF